MRIFIYFLFFIVYLPKKMETEKWPKAADSLICFITLLFTFIVIDDPNEKNSPVLRCYRRYSFRVLCPTGPLPNSLTLLVLEK